MDFLRAASILVVVLGHWLIAVVYWKGGEVTGVNALSVIPGIWLATWLLQVMPIFFFVGGFSNWVSAESTLRRGGGFNEFLYTRVNRLMRPTLFFCLTWIIGAAVLESIGLPRATVRLATRLVAQPLWFLGIYMIVVAFAPAMMRLHRKFGLRVPIVLALIAAGVDLIRLSLDVPYLGYLNFGTVWLFAHQLGFFYGDGSLGRRSRTTFALMVAGGLTALLMLTNVGPYPNSMVGLPGDKVSNMDPPSVCIIALTVWQVGLVMLLRDSFARWLSRVRVWASVIALNAVIMTMFLWHLTAFLIAVVLLYPIGFPQPLAGSALWWGLRPVWIAALLAFLAPFVLIFGRLERAPAPERSPA